MSVTKPMQLTVSIISNSVTLSNLGAMLHTTFSRQYCLKCLSRSITVSVKERWRYTTQRTTICHWWLHSRFIIFI